MYRQALVVLLSLLFPCTALGAGHLLYFEAQGIGGYSSELGKPIYYSMNPDAEMQKPSVGFDYVQKFSGDSGDIATFALQARFAVAVDGTEGRNRSKLEPQVYNAYVKFRTPGPYVWVGHNRPAFGLSSYFDSHGLLLRTLAIEGFGYDRDWGTGLYKDFSWGDISVSATTGSGMPVYLDRGSYMTAARISYGVLSQKNMNAGFSLGYGNTLDTMGYRLREGDPTRMALAAIDFTVLRNRFEHRFDSLAGQWLGETTYAFLYRLGVNIGQENRFKIEAQPLYRKIAGTENYQFSLCGSAIVTSNLTVRLAPSYDHENNDKRVVLQLYYYRPITSVLQKSLPIENR